MIGEDKKMKWLIVPLVSILIAPVAFAEPFVNPDMIQISYDGVSFADASLLISGIVISVGAVSGQHITHARRGDIITYEAPLGTPHTDMKVSWKLDTGQIAASENKLYVRFFFGVSETLEDGTLHHTVARDPSEPSNVVKLIGEPGKPRNQG